MGFYAVSVGARSATSRALQGDTRRPQDLLSAVGARRGQEGCSRSRHHVPFGEVDVPGTSPIEMAPRPEQPSFGLVTVYPG